MHLLSLAPPSFLSSQLPFLNPFPTAPCGSGLTRSAPRAEITVGCRAIQVGLQEIVYQCKRQASIVDLNGRYCP